MNPSGAMASDTMVGSYYVDKSGAWIPNYSPAHWIRSGQRWWYRKWYFMNPSGAMASDTMVGSYYVDKSGAWIPNYSPAHWIRSGQRWWYRHSDGTYTVSDWEKINGTWYLFDEEGWMLTGWSTLVVSSQRWHLHGL